MRRSILFLLIGAVVVGGLYLFLADNGPAPTESTPAPAPAPSTPAAPAPSQEKAEDKVAPPPAAESEKAEKPALPSGCSPKFQMLAKSSVVSLEGTGEGEAMVVTDPFCWHCRLGHKLLREYPGKYRAIKLVFYPHEGFPGSDMAAWILEDAAGKDYLQDMINFAYTDLKMPKTKDQDEARAVVLAQFMILFPDILQEKDFAAEVERLRSAHESHVMIGHAMAKSANVPGTPVLVAGDTVLPGYGPGPWLKALDEMTVCP